MPRKRIDLVGNRVGRLTVLSAGPVKRTRTGTRYFWNCRCDCGEEVTVDACCLRRESTRSCGCFARELHTKHGMAVRDRFPDGRKEHPVYVIWSAIKARCFNPRHSSFSEYGGRGITMCIRWKQSFSAFHDDMGDRPTPKHTIERNDNSGNYEPGNCRWATRAEQNENTRQTRLLTYDGTTLSVGKWARRLGVDRKTITARLDRYGWSVERALSTPTRPTQRA